MLSLYFRSINDNILNANWEIICLPLDAACLVFDTCYPSHLQYTHYVNSNCLGLIIVFLSHRNITFFFFFLFFFLFFFPLLFFNEQHWHHFWHICRVLRNEIIPAYLFVLRVFCACTLYIRRQWSIGAPYENKNRIRHSIWSILIGFLFFFFCAWFCLVEHDNSIHALIRFIPHTGMRWRWAFKIERNNLVKRMSLYCLRIANSIENESNNWNKCAAHGSLFRLFSSIFVVVFAVVKRIKFIALDKIMLLYR